MHATQLLNTQLYKECQDIHKIRWKALMATVGACIEGKKLSVTGLGRAIVNMVYEKHNIKRADRLIGNAHLNRERGWIHRALARKVIGHEKNPVILIDWSPLSADGHFHLLRASLPIGGRALTVHDEVHPEKLLNNGKVEKRFLKHLKENIPEHCRPIIITDSGYRTPWFRAVLSMGWDFVGRVGGHTMIRLHSQGNWNRIEKITETATTRARYFGCIDLVKRTPLACYAYLVKKKSLGRVKKNVFGKRSKMKHSEKNAERERSPWFIVTSLTGGASITKRVMNLYKTRMQIEQGFRDVKNTRWGFSLEEAKITMACRYENLLLVGTLATFAVWLVGKIAELKNVHRRYQANTIKIRNVLSTFYLGCRVLKKQAVKFKLEDYNQALMALQENFKAQCFV